MSSLPLAILLLLGGIVLIAGIYDLRFRRIPNWLVLSGFTLGVALNVVFYGMVGLRQSALGMGLALLIYFPIYLLRGMGAGDVKLMAAIGAAIGPLNWLGVFFFTGVLGGICGVALLLCKGRLNQGLWNITFILRDLVHLRAPYKGNRELDVSSPRAVRMPHGAVIALGSFAFIAVTIFWAPK